MFRRLLIANRGEIASRIVRACDTLGIESVVVFSEADRDAPWLSQATRAVCVGPAAAAESYLNADAILQAAEQTDCQALHPGYGFLAENALFAARCGQQGLTFVGPPPAAIRRMGDKLAAKRAMASHGVPVIPGSAEALSDAEDAIREAERIGYPVLLKAAAGGGGRGMRRCVDAGDVHRAFAEASREAEQAFGDGSLYLEKLMGAARHIEFQVLVDGYGHALHLGERECSVQRKHQKLVEEAPSVAIDAPTRERWGTRVASAVAALGYRGAGTVEFLRVEDGKLFFMEMNARLQVEHPVTEMVTGVDLVVEQLRIAAGEPLRLTQDALRFSGHAVEFRVNAEDPTRDFRPDPGTITALRPPASGKDGIRVRWDCGVASGYRIPPHYDSMIGKLIVHGPDRAATLAAAAKALGSLVVEGVATTIPFHQQLLRDPAFVSGAYDTGLLERDAAAKGARGRG